MSVIYYPYRLDEEIPPGVPRLPGSNFEKVQTNALAPEIQKAIDELAARAAAGEADAVESFYELAASATTQLGNIARRTPEFLRPIAGNWPVFPVLASPKDKRTQTTKSLLKRLGVASDLGQQFSSKSRWSLENTATRYAAAMEYTIETNAALVNAQRTVSPQRLEKEVARFPQLYSKAAAFPEWVERAARLPEFNKLSADKWFEVGWLALMEASNGQPEKIKALRVLGNYRAKHTSTAKPGSNTERSNIRDGIRERIGRAMLTIAPDSSPHPEV